MGMRLRIPFEVKGCCGGFSVIANKVYFQTEALGMTPKQITVSGGKLTFSLVVLDIVTPAKWCLWLTI